MSHRSSLNKILGGTLFLALLVTPAAAHKVEVSENVAGTWHIEPDHNPKAGETARVWIALTRKGGKILPLEQGNCQLAVYSQPRTPGGSPVLQPPLKAISAEQHQGIPGADIVFPTAGIYQLELTCTPKTEGDFQPFQINYEATVASGVTAPSPNSEISLPSTEVAQSQEATASPTTKEESPFRNQPAPEWSVWAIVLAIIIGLGTLSIVVRRTLKR